MGNKRTYGKYFLGLDIGTSSVGWAVTDPDYQIQKFGSKEMWGVRLFDEAHTAEERRLFRVSRRRLERRSQRLGLLQELFKDAIDAVDSGFFMRLQEGALHEEHKTVRQPNTLFAGEAYTDKEYHRDYPTIYHLRHELMTSTEPHDVRLVYLAVHHIIKYRGHFLFAGSMESRLSLSEILSELSQEVEDQYGIAFECSDTDEAERVLKDQSLKMSEKQKRLNKLFGVSDPQTKALIKAVTGGKVKVSDLLGTEKEDEAKRTIDFGADDYEEQTEELENILGDSYLLVYKLKAIYDWALLENLCPNNRSFSETKVEVYETHKRDLALLKRVIKRHCPEKYSEVFHHADVKGNYASYIGMTKRNGRKIPLKATCTQKEFGGYVKKLLKDITDDEDVTLILKRVEEGTFMPKATTKSNGIIPNQLHEQELKIILENASAYLLFLTQKDEEGLSVKDKILQILKYKIPYYVGPLNDRNPKAQNCWVVRKSQEKIYPWNFDKVVDVEESAANFITRMTARCTYLHDKTVLPANSILYARFKVLNELNNLKIDGEKLSVEQKQAIYNECFLKKKRVTPKQIIAFFAAQGKKIGKEQITGIDGDFKANLRPLIEMRELLGSAYTEEIAEEVIRLCTVFGDEQKMLKLRLKAALGYVLPEGVIEKASRKRYSGWGRLSRAFLAEISAPTRRGDEYRSIIERLWQTNHNLMELLSDEFGYMEAIEQHNRAFDDQQGFGYHLVKDLYVSPSVKRQIWQTLKIVKEIQKVTVHAPEKIFVEVARGSDGKEGRKESRKARLNALYQSCKGDAQALSESLGQLGTLAEALGRLEDSDLRRDRLYLYYTQLGRCMYTGKPIDLAKLYDENVYDIDHIYPQSKVKDDSLDNRVLVMRQVNAEKEDVYPIKKEIRDSQHSFWEVLRKKNLISQKKYERLTRSKELEPSELLDFINRQLVETRQSTKEVARLLKDIFPQSEIVYVKAGLVSDFRHDFDILKCREVNDLHHAKDAYLNIVVGNVYNTKFTHDPRNFFAGDNHHYNLKKLFAENVTRNNITAWKAGDDGSIATVKKNVMRNRVLVTKMATEVQGQLFDVQLVKKGKWQLPQKGTKEYFKDTTKYGGYNAVRGAYFMLVEHTEKKKRVRSLIDFPLHLKERVKDEEAIISMLKTEKQLVDPVVLIPKIRKNAVIEVNGFPMYITGRSGAKIVYAPAVQLVVGYQNERYIRNLMKFRKRQDEYGKTHKDEKLMANANDHVSREENLALYDLLVDKMENSVYAVRFSEQAAKLEEKRAVFGALAVETQCEVLEQMLLMLACNRSTGDLSAIGLADHAGTVSTNSKLSQYQSARLINQSITGLFEHSEDLLA